MKMHSKMKKITTFVVALCAAATAFAGCGSSSYSPKKLQGNISGAVAEGQNGGFVVEKGDFVYFVNGSEDYTAKNSLGNVKKGALMRIAKTDLSAKKYGQAEIVVPYLFVAQDTTSGIYLYGDYVYFASPTTERNKDGSIAKSKLSFHRAKLDGSSTEKEIKDYLFRLETRDVTYRFVEVGGVVYCMYEEDGTLYSFNTKTEKKHVLVENASSEFYFDKNNLSNPNVYYTMAVTEDIGTDNAQTVSYNQVYSVCADATASANADKLSYTTSLGYTYSFDKAIKDDKGFDASDYDTYPYVNLGELVLDGKGASKDSYPMTQYNHDDSDPDTPNGYIYGVQSYVDGGAYLTRKDVNSSASDGEGETLYYLADETKNADGWKSVAGNATLSGNKVALDTTNASASAVFEVKDGVHTYMYTSGTTVRKATANADGTVKEDVLLVPAAAEGTVLLKADGKWLYFHSTGTNGNNLWRVDYTGAKSDYSGLAPTDAYKAQQILELDWNSSWYKPKFVGSQLFYSNAQSFGSRAYNYVTVVDLSGSGADGMMTYEELEAFNEKYQDVKEHISELEGEYPNLAKAMRYYFRTGETKVYDEFLADAKAQGYKDHYRYSAYELETFEKFTSHTDEYADMFKDGEFYYDVESYFYNTLGVKKASDEKAIAAVWASNDFIAPLPDLSEDGKDNTAKVVWTVVGVTLGVLAVLAAIIVPVVISHKKKAKLLADREATRVRSRDRIDVSDDKSIDVYATEDEEEPVKEATEEPVEEPVEEASEAEESTEE